MARALPPVSANPLFRTHSKLTVQKGAYTYTVQSSGADATYSVTDGVNTITAPLHWIFGANSQTYVLERDGQFYESLVSYWKTVDGLDTTVGDGGIQPKSLNEAFGRPLAKSEITLCFGCHSTGSVTHHELHLDSVTPGVTCSHCHTDANTHMQAVSQGKSGPIPQQLKQRSPEAISEFCGQCHRTWETVMRNKWLGPMNVRFQPYRLALSKCFDGQDARMSCIGCHNPHQEVVRDDRSYDAKCLACHSNGAKLSPGMSAEHPEAVSMKMCKVGTSNCISCHMPKVDLPGGAHQQFTDHFIRIARVNEPYPH